MKKNIFLLVILVILVTSCDRMFHMAGKVVDATNGLPITNAEIITSEHRTIYSDSLGKFDLNLFGPGSNSDNLEVLVHKDGYQSTFFDLSQEEDLMGITLELKPGNLPFQTKYSSSLVEIFYKINLYVVNLIVLLTILFVFYKKVRFYLFWIAAILFLNMTLRINYIDGSLSFDFLHLPFYLKSFAFYPFTIKIPLLLGTLAFWGYYLFSRFDLKKAL